MTLLDKFCQKFLCNSIFLFKNHPLEKLIIKSFFFTIFFSKISNFNIPEQVPYQFLQLPQIFSDNAKNRHRLYLWVVGK